MRFLFLFLFSAFVATGRPPRETEYRIRVIVPKELRATKVYVDRIVADRLVRDSGLVRNGEAMMSGKIAEPIKGNVLVLMATDAGKEAVKFVPVLLESANIVVDASGGWDSVLYAGSETQRLFNEWQTALKPIFKQMDAYWMALANGGGAQSGDKPDISVLQESAGEIQRQFFTRHPQSLATALLLIDFVSPVWDHTAEAKQFFDNLPPELKSLPQMQSFEKDLAIAVQMAPGKRFPSISLPDTAEKKAAVASAQGMYVLVDFWASWCMPCRIESPALVSAHRKFSPKGFAIVSVSFDQNKEAWKAAIRKDGYTWTNLIDTTGMGPQGLVSGKFNIMAIPRNFLLDRQGIVVAVNLRGPALEKKLHELLP